VKTIIEPSALAFFLDSDRCNGSIFSGPWDRPEPVEWLGVEPSSRPGGEFFGHGRSDTRRRIPLESPRPQFWKSIASSADGSKLVAAVEYFDEHLIGGGIWTSLLPAAPSMQITRNENGLNLSWLVPSTDFVLQQSADLSGWSILTNQPVLNLTNLQNEVSLPTSGGAFFRLKTQEASDGSGESD